MFYDLLPLGLLVESSMFRSIVIIGSRCYKIDIGDLKIITIPSGYVGMDNSWLCNERIKIFRVFVIKKIHEPIS